MLKGTFICELIPVAGVATLMTQGDPQLWVTLGMLITLAGNVIYRRMDVKKAERQREWEIEDRKRHREDLKRRIGRVARTTRATREAILGEIQANTALTAEVARKADAVLGIEDSQK